MKILITTSTLPASEEDKVPAFVKDQALAFKKYYPHSTIIIHAPHNSYSNTKSQRVVEAYHEVRFHYFWPRRFELLTGRGIMPALKSNRFLYLQIPFLFIFQFISLLGTVKKERPGLIYAHWFTPQAINAALVSKITGIPFSFTTHASDVIVLRKVPFSKHIVRYVCARSKSYTAVSKRTALKLKSFFSDTEWEEKFSHKLTIVPMGVPIDNPEAENLLVDRAMKKFQLPQQKQYVLFLGRLAEKKGVSYLIKAFSLLPAQVSGQMHLIVAGDGQLKSSLEKLSRKLNVKNITFTGYVHGDDKKALLTMADYVCFPSIIDSSGDSEGFPVVLMEGLAAGKIVIASDTTGAEDILDNGKNGFIVPEKSSKDLGNSLEKAHNLNIEERRKIRKEAKILAKKFDIELLTREYGAILGLDD